MDQRNVSIFEIILSIFGVLISILIAFVVTKYGYVKSDNGCDGTGWIAYRDDKCYKLVQQSVKYNEAKDICASSRNWFSFDSTTPQLVSIKSDDEQDHLTKLISELKVNVWIRAKQIDNKIVWDDDDSQEDIEYSNWIEGNTIGENTIDKNPIDENPIDENPIDENPIDENPIDKNINTNCVSMQSDGKWINVNCEESSFFICEKLQKWSYEKLHKTLLKTRKRLSNNENQLTTVRNNPVPIGFVYVQLPNQPDPQSLWPENLEWKDVTSEYAGLFFRAEGGGAAEFGTEQDENSPRITQARNRGHISESDGGLKWDHITLTVGEWSSGIGLLTGTYDMKYGLTHQFYTSDGEVRPRNAAIRIWKRIK